MNLRGYSPYRYEYDFKFNDFVSKPETLFLDAGSGPVSDCGSVTDKTNLIIRAVDPLAEAYALMKKQHGLVTKIAPEFCCVELLSGKFSEETFDIVHMRNSLDHSFNPVLGIIQMLYVCKTGGKLILVHFDNEAECENYDGLHQWNLNVRDSKFTIWRGERKLDAGEIFGEYADIECIPAVNDGHKRYHTVILTKKKLVPLINDPNKNLFISGIMSSLLEYIFNAVKNDYESERKFMRRARRKAGRIIRRLFH